MAYWCKADSAALVLQRRLQRRRDQLRNGALACAPGTIRFDKALSRELQGVPPGAW